MAGEYFYPKAPHYFIDKPVARSHIECTGSVVESGFFKSLEDTMAKAKTSVCTREYFNADGEKTRGARPDTVRAVMTFSNGESIELDPTKVGDGCRNALLFHGLTAKVGDKFAGKGGDVEAAHEAAAAMYEQLCEDIWVKEGEKAGPRIGLLVEAIVAAKEKAGMEADADAITANLKANPELRKSALANPAIDAEYKRIQAERAAAKAKEAAKAAKSSEEATEGLGTF